MSVANVEQRLSPGTAVEVWNEYLGRWCRGFDIEDSTSNGYLLRRRSDGLVLPAAFDGARVRPGS